MFGRYTEQAKKVMALANQEAQRYNHVYVGTGHILLGLIREGTGAGSDILRKHGVTEEAARPQVEKLFRAGPGSVPMAKPAMTPQAKKVCSAAAEAARQGSPEGVDTEQLLLGLLDQTDDAAVAALRALGADVAAMRQDVLTHMKK